MSTSRNTFNEVKGLLGRLERSIDEARNRRLGGPTRPEPVIPDRTPGGTPLDVVIGRAEDTSGKPLPLEAPASSPEAPAAPRSKFGRAKPLSRPAGSDGFPGSWAG